MNWNINKAKACMFKLGMDHIKDGLFVEGGELVFESRWGDGCDTDSLFKETIKNICCWDVEDIDSFMKENVANDSQNY